MSVLHRQLHAHIQTDVNTQTIHVHTNYTKKYTYRQYMYTLNTHTDNACTHKITQNTQTDNTCTHEIHIQTIHVHTKHTQNTQTDNACPHTQGRSSRRTLSRTA